MIEQRKLTVTLETVTPMFLAGADQQKPELRAPSFMGALRYWTRAALGGVLGDNNLEALKKAEEEVWGSTNGTGAVQIQLIADTNFTAQHLKALPHKPDSDRASNTKFYAIPAGARFKIVLRQYVPSPETWNMAIAAFLLMAAHGGVGKRSRRGWGTVVIKELTPQDGLPEFAQVAANLLSKQGMSIGDWYEYRKWVVEHGLCTSRKLVEHLDLSSEQPQKFPTKFPVLSNKPSQMTTVLVKKAYASFDEAIVAFGSEEHQFGPGKEFGSADRPRWGSPLWVRVLPIGNKPWRYILGMTILQSDSSVANYAKLDAFIDKWPTLPKERAK